MAQLWSFTQLAELLDCPTLFVVSHRARWLLPLGYAAAFVALWPGLFAQDDGSGLPYLGVFLLGLPWSVGAAWTGHTGDMVVVAFAGLANLVLISLFVKRLDRSAHSN